MTFALLFNLHNHLYMFCICREGGKSLIAEKFAHPRYPMLLYHYMLLLDVTVLVVFLENPKSAFLTNYQAHI